MRVLFLSQFFQPEPFFRALPFARDLQKEGFEVEALTGFPNYPGGKVYKGYEIRAYRREVLEGVTVHRTALYPSHDASGLRRMANYLSFGFSALFFGAPKVGPVRIVYCYNLVTLVFAALWFRWRDGAKIVFDVQDLWPESVAHSGMMRSRPLAKLLKLACDHVYRLADHITALSPGFKRALVERGVDPGKISVVYNWCEHEEPACGDRDGTLATEYGIGGTFNVMYAGNIGALQCLDTLLDAARLCRETHPDVRFVLVGGGVDRERLEARKKSERLENVVFLPRQSQEGMSCVYGLADVAIVHLKAIPLFEITVPSKTQAYMAAGLPVLMGVRGDALTLVERAEGGVGFEPENAASLAAAVAKLRDLAPEARKAMGENSRAFYLKHLSRAAGVESFARIFSDLVTEEPRN